MDDTELCDQYGVPHIEMTIDGVEHAVYFDVDEVATVELVFRRLDGGWTELDDLPESIEQAIWAEVRQRRETYTIEEGNT